jgi:hypothetical protein
MCGCTEQAACAVDYGGLAQGCSWVFVDRRRGLGRCSACASLEELLAVFLGVSVAAAYTAPDLAEFFNRPLDRIRAALLRLEERELVARDTALGGAVRYRRVA